MKEVRRAYFKKIVGPLFFILISGVALSGCGDTECYENKNSLPLAGFYNSSLNPHAISVDSISILGVGAPGDSILKDSVRSISQVYLPFRIDQGSTTYEIRYLGGEAGKLHIADFITFNYEIIPYFVSTACGAVYNYKMTTIEHSFNFIDSVTCPLGEITNVNIENIKIYFRTDVDEE